MFPSIRTATNGVSFEDSSSVHCDRDGSGAGSYLKLYTETTFNVHNTAHTFAFWFKRDAYDWDRIMANANAPNNTNDYKFILLGNEAAKNQIMFECDTDGNHIKTSEHEGDLHKWYHLVITTDGSESGQFYENGRALTTVKDGDGDGLTAAITFDAIGFLHNGWINDLAIYEADIGAAGAKALYNNKEPYNHQEGSYASDLIHWWRMGDGMSISSGHGIKDQAGSLDTIFNLPLLGAKARITGDVPW